MALQTVDCDPVTPVKRGLLEISRKLLVGTYQCRCSNFRLGCKIEKFLLSFFLKNDSITNSPGKFKNYQKIHEKNSRWSQFSV